VVEGRAGVTQAVVVGIDADTSGEVVDFVGCRRGLFAAVGIHPNESGKATDAAFDRIARLARDERVVAVGESGIDLYWRDAAPECQVRWLERHAELSLACGKPLVLHLRDAFAEARAVLEPFARRGLRAVVHCFTGGPGDLHPFVGWGFLVSFSGILTYPKAAALRSAAALVPLEQCLVETDAPWLAPAPRRGDTNEPALVVHTARALAEARGVQLSEIASATTANARRFFSLPAP